MSEQINSGQVEESEISTSGLLLSVEPLQAGAQLDASDGKADTGGAGEKDTSDDTSADADGSDESGTKGADTDLTDALGADSDGSDDTADADGSDDSDAEIKIDGKDA